MAALALATGCSRTGEPLVRSLPTQGKALKKEKVAPLKNRPLPAAPRRKRLEKKNSNQR